MLGSRLRFATARLGFQVVPDREMAPRPRPCGVGRRLLPTCRAAELQRVPSGLWYFVTPDATGHTKRERVLAKTHQAKRHPVSM